MNVLRPSTIGEASALIGANARPLAGGTILVPALGAGAQRPETLVDLSRLSELFDVRVEQERLVIGAMVTAERLATLDAAYPQLGALAQAARELGNPHVRRAATIGGNIAVSAPESDLATALLALDAQVRLANGDTHAYGEAAPITSGLIVHLDVPIGGGLRSAFRKYARRRATAAAVVSVAAVVRRGGDTIAHAAVAFGGLCRPTRAPAVEAHLTGHAIANADVFAAAAAVTSLPVASLDRYRSALLQRGVRETLLEVLR